MEPPDSACVRCGKPIRPGTMSQIAGRPVHIYCLARDLQAQARDLQQASSQARVRSAATVETAAGLVARARAVRDCPVCGRSLAQGGGVLFQGDRLVHAVCWQAPPAASVATR
jgi:hypothetical protein